MPGIADDVRTALEVIRRERGGDPLAAIDELVVSHGEAVRGEDVLKLMAVSLNRPGTVRDLADARRTQRGRGQQTRIRALVI